MSSFYNECFICLTNILFYYLDVFNSACMCCMLFFSANIFAILALSIVPFIHTCIFVTIEFVGKYIYYVLVVKFVTIAQNFSSFYLPSFVRIMLCYYHFNIYIFYITIYTCIVLYTLTFHQLNCPCLWFRSEFPIKWGQWIYQMLSTRSVTDTIHMLDNDL